MGWGGCGIHPIPLLWKEWNGVGSVRHAHHATHVQSGLAWFEALTANLEANKVKDNLNGRRPSDDDTPSVGIPSHRPRLLYQDRLYMCKKSHGVPASVGRTSNRRLATVRGVQCYDVVYVFRLRNVKPVAGNERVLREIESYVFKVLGVHALVH